MSDLLTFLSSVTAYWAWAAGGALAVAVSFYFAWHNKPVPRYILLILGILFLVTAFYKVWLDQYRENQGSRDAGALSLGDMRAEWRINPKTRNYDVSLILPLKNLQSRLIQIRMDTFELGIDSISAVGQLTNDGRGMIPGGQSVDFRLPAVSGVEYRDGRASAGKLTYQISYNAVGSKVVHHSGRTFSFDLAPKGRTSFFLISEHED